MSSRKFLLTLVTVVGSGVLLYLKLLPAEAMKDIVLGATFAYMAGNVGATWASR